MTRPPVLCAADPDDTGSEAPGPAPAVIAADDDATEEMVLKSVSRDVKVDSSAATMVEDDIAAVTLTSTAGAVVEAPFIADEPLGAAPPMCAVPVAQLGRDQDQVPVCLAEKSPL